MSGAVLEVPVKFALVRNGEVVETRRARLVNPSFETVVGAGAQWAKGTTSMQYKDDEGDLVTMDTEEEWKECMRLWEEAGATGPLSLRLVLPSIGEGRPGRWWRELHKMHAAKRCRSRSGSRTRGGRCRSGSGDRHRMRRCQRNEDEDGEGEAGPKQAEVVEKVLRRLHGDDTMAALAEGRVDAGALGCEEWLKVSVLGDGEVDLDVQVRGLYRVLDRRGLRALADMSEEAVAWFELCTELCPKASRGWYNLGCAHLVTRLPMQKTDEARDGVTGVALDALEEAVKCGYHQWRHMMVDEDLMSIRAHPRFLALFPERGHCRGQRMNGNWWGGLGVLGHFLGRHEHRNEQFEAGEACSGCDFATTGLAPGACCWRCLKEPGNHGPYCKREAVAEAMPVAEATPVPVVEGEVPVTMSKAGLKLRAKAEKAEMKAEKAEMKALAKAERKREKEERKNMAKTACQSAGCGYEASGRAGLPGFCCKKCARGAGHGKWCGQKEFEREMISPSPSPVEVEPVPVLEPVEVPVDEPVPVLEPVPEPLEEVPPPPAEIEYAEQIACLRNMGFPIDDAMLLRLGVHGGDLVKVVNSML